MALYLCHFVQNEVGVNGIKVIWSVFSYISPVPLSFYTSSNSNLFMIATDLSKTNKKNQASTKYFLHSIAFIPKVSLHLTPLVCWINIFTASTK